MLGERPLRLALVGGGPGSFIGPVHRMAAELDGELQLVAGAFSSSPSLSRSAGKAYGIAPDRVYTDLESLLSLERRRDDAVDVVVIATPNHLHFPMSMAALRAGFAVVCEKPATVSLEQALQLRTAIRAGSPPFSLTYTYSGYSMVREARTRCLAGSVGEIRKVVVEYSQGWLADPLGQAESKQASWRADPARAGRGGCSADIGVHAFHLLEFVTGLRALELVADLSALVPGRALDDDCNVLLRLERGARAVLHASQVAVGELNGIRIRVYGSLGGLEWTHDAPEKLLIHRLHEPTLTLQAGTNGTQLDPGTRRASRLPVGHPEGYVEALGTLYRDFGELVRARSRGTSAPSASLVPTIDDGVRGLAFVETALASSRAVAGWLRLPETGP